MNMLRIDHNQPTLRPCSECGRKVQGITEHFDPTSGSHVQLCALCASVFLQRQQFSSGCCGD
jgi:hypothetical protein